MRVTQRAIQALGDEMRVVRNGFFVGVCAYALIGATSAMAQADQVRNFDLPAQSLTEALRAIARQSGLEFSAPADPLRGKTSKPLRGQFSPAQAAKQLLKGSTLTAEVIDGALIISVGRVSTATSTLGNGDDIIVTGSRLSSEESSSPTIKLDADTIKLAGQADVGEAMRSLPQNFSGGQNPGVMSGTTGSGNGNVSSGSSPNLRGLGGDATLTLMNGHRLSYGARVQAVDVSTIPLAAIDHVDIVADGASAIYGSDAVGGVVNVVLKRNFDGATLVARLGAATSGGDVQQQYSAVIGKTWQTGAVLAAVSHDYNSAIYSHDRSFTQYMPQGTTLYPEIKQTNAIISGHQSIGSIADISIDATYSRRTSFQQEELVYGDIYQNSPETESYSISPSLKIKIAPDWHFSFGGTYGRSDTKFDQIGLYEGTQTSRIRGCYCNELANIEGFVSGRIPGIIANPIGIVVGGGYRYNHYTSTRYSASRADSAGSVKSYYAFSELSLPFVEPGQGGLLLHSLSANAAVRYERYPGIANVAVPKFGVVYGVSPSIDIKTSWGKSFKAPLLNDLRAATYAQLYTADTFGGARFPVGSTMLIESGGNADLKPEKATSWSASIAVHPEWIKGFNLQVSYFNVQYKDRVVQPVAGTAVYQALSNPDYEQYVTYDPSQTLVDQTIANADLFYNYTTLDGLNNVVAILNNRYVNAAKQKIDGIDLTADYRIDIGTQSAMLLNANGAWLWSKQKLTSESTALDMAGIIFNPPRFKARGSIGWTDGNFTSMLYVNHISSLKDTRSTTVAKISSQTTFDGSIRYELPTPAGPFHGVSALLSVQNIFNQRPPYAAPTSGYLDYVNYDSTNFSAIGRFISLTLSKDW
ncbi:TonB-dependent receptor [Novosphingobium sp. KA1]|uniref:TonB-dependent receptor n=1 Tax=Novosphingobium sp. (strain KA1) TaxID=164608 RepID=UPI001F5D8622|nr:TonB-dependent receptor [Novosphingobium sp. KA1]